MKTFKLNVHQKHFSEAEVLISEKDYPAIKLGTVIEIYTPEDDFSRLLLQINSFAEEKDFQQKDKPPISIEQSIATTFQLRTYSDVIVDVVNPKDVSLDSVEMFFKDQYLSRSDMWRLKKHLTNTCVYLNKKIEINGIRCCVFEMWSQGERVASGYVNDDTKIVYRSTSSMVYLFLQMSSEMWDFDINGDLYFEKAVDGFLANLFEKWKRCNCNHDVTIVLFSRTFYDAKRIEEFPEFMQPCLQQDYKGRYYEDFYRVPVQNERLDDWSSTLILLKKIFNHYETEVLKYHEKDNLKIPRAFNSTSSQGNFLEVLNMALNVFEKHYLDRSFDRTGQLSVVISPGVGVFEVDLDLTNITKQRIIDNGIGSDLVCLGEQPLHAVPLFKFNRKQSVPSPVDAADVYNMPHWINLSFYSSSKQTNFANFVPRIKMPNILLTIEETKKNQLLLRSPSRESNGKGCRNMPSLVTFEEYDSMVFKAPCHSLNTTHTCQPSRRRVSASSPTRKREPANRCNSRRASDALTERFSDDVDESSNHVKSDKMSIPSIKSTVILPTSTLSTSIESKSSKEIRTRIESQDDLILRGHSGIQNTSLLIPRPKALINPFDPSHLTIKLTSNRRRWTHVFPLGPTGIFMQQHHYQAIPQNTACTLLPSQACVNPPFCKTSVCDISDQNDMNYRKSFSQTKHEFSLQNFERKISPKGQSIVFNHNSDALRIKSANHRTTSSIFSADPHTDKSLTWAWGATGEQEWTPAITTGVDWKSLVKPACLPITTDFFPDSISLQNDFVLSDYTLSLEDQSVDLFQKRSFRGEDENRYRCSLNIEEVYQELICQRLQQGFQIILDQKIGPTYSQSLSNTQFENKHSNRCKHTLSIGRIFHSLELENSEVKVTQYRPRHPYQTFNIHYCYRFRAPDNETYGVSWVDFASEKLENYNWSYLDSYICLRGEGEYKLMESLKFWRFRLLLLPAMLQTTKKIIESLMGTTEKLSSQFTRCDIYCPLSKSDIVTLEDGFLKFMEVVNKIRRPPTSAKKWSKAEVLKSYETVNRRNSFTQSCTVQKLAENTFRDRIGSSSDHDRPKIKTLLKYPDKQKDEISSNFLSQSTKFGTEMPSKSPSERVESISENKRLTANAPKKEIIDSMKTSGFYFLNKQGDLPSNTFISTEAVIWAISNVEGVDCEEFGVNLFQEALTEGLICHASGDSRHPFKYGFYLYYIVDKNCQNPSNSDCDLEIFRKEWFEVELTLNNSDSSDLESEVQETDFVVPKITEFKYNTAILDFDGGSRGDRSEWVHVKYSSIYNPGQAFELTLEWMVATGNQIADVVQMWARKASPALHLVPIPSDPFALPSSGKSDPLRGPIFVTLNINDLPSVALNYFSDDRLLRFQERILTIFGFVPFYDVLHEVQRQYVHISGSIFVLIPNRKLSQGTPTQADGICCSPHEEYITRHFSGFKQTEKNGADNKKIGFLWSWNYMITKRWKTPATGDETFQRRVLKDFRMFCANGDNRLCSFWDTYQLETSYDDDEPMLSFDS